MGSATKHQTRPIPNPATSSDTENPMELDSAPPPLPPAFTIDDHHQDLILSKSRFLTRQEVIKRRHRRLKHEIQLYEDFYWGLMEEYRAKHREYYWEYGKSPFEEDEEVEKERGGDEGVGEVGGGGVGGSDGQLGVGSGGKNKRCGYSGCKAKAMALTDYCHAHILSDRRQKLYKACKYTIKSPHTGPVHCGKPILTSTVPSLCAMHFEKARIHVTRALKKVGLNVTSASKLSPKFHTIVAESIQNINIKRQIMTSVCGNGVTKDEDTVGGNGLLKMATANAGFDAIMEEDYNVGNGLVEENAD